MYTFLTMHKLFTSRTASVAAAKSAAAVTTRVARVVASKPIVTSQPTARSISSGGAPALAATVRRLAASTTVRVTLALTAGGALAARRGVASTSSGGDFSAAAEVDELIRNNAVVVFSKSYCPYCHATKELLTSLGARFLVVELDERQDGADLQQALALRTRQRTVPSTFIAGRHIGGNDATQALHREGKLVPELTAAGVISK